MTGIVVGVDGSAHSDRALEWAVKEAAARHMPLSVIIVYSAGGPHWSKELENPEGPGERETGDPADVLLSAAEDADMIVVGARGIGGFARLLVGSVSSQLVYHAPCPVVVVPSDRQRESWRAVA